MRTLIFVVWFIVVYLLLKSLIRKFLSGSKRYSFDKNIRNNKNSSIDKRDVIDADYEDVSDKDQQNKN